MDIAAGKINRRIVGCTVDVRCLSIVSKGRRRSNKAKSKIRYRRGRRRTMPYLSMVGLAMKSRITMMISECTTKTMKTGIMMILLAAMPSSGILVVS